MKYFSFLLLLFSKSLSSAQEAEKSTTIPLEDISKIVLHQHEASLHDNHYNSTNTPYFFIRSMIETNNENGWCLQETFNNKKNKKTLFIAATCQIESASQMFSMDHNGYLHNKNYPDKCVKKVGKLLKIDNCKKDSNAMKWIYSTDGTIRWGNQAIFALAIPDKHTKPQGLKKGVASLKLNKLANKSPAINEKWMLYFVDYLDKYGDYYYGEHPRDDYYGEYPRDDYHGEYPGDDYHGEYPGDNHHGEYPGDRDKNHGEYPGDNHHGEYPGDGDNQHGEYPGDNQHGEYPGDNHHGEYPGDNHHGEYPGDNNHGEYPGDNNHGKYPDDGDNHHGGYPGDGDNQHAGYPGDEKKPSDKHGEYYPGEDTQQGDKYSNDSNGKYYSGDNHHDGSSKHGDMNEGDSSEGGLRK